MRAIPAAVAAAVISLIAVPLASANNMGTDWVSSDNVEYLGSIKQDVGLTAGAKVVGDRLFVTSGKNITIYDISTPETPVDARLAEGQRRVGERGGADQRQGPRRRERLLLRDAELRLRARGGRLHPVLRRARSGEHPGGRLRPDRQPHGGVRARLPVVLRPRRHDRRRARDPRRQGAHGGRRLDRGAEGAGRRLAELPPHPRDPAGRAADGVPAVLGDHGEPGGRAGRVARAPEGPLHGRGREVRPLRALAAPGPRQVPPHRR